VNGRLNDPAASFQGKNGKLGKTQSKSRHCEEQRFEVLSVITIYIYIYKMAGIAQPV
jgi:hypothetical protein